MNADKQKQHLSQRVLLVSQRMLPYVAGAELKALNLARSFIRLGVDARIATTRFARGLAARETIRGVDVRRLPVLRASMARASQFLAVASYVAAMGRTFDIVHANCLSASSLGAIAGAKLSGVPVILQPSLGGMDGELRRIIESPAAPLLLSLLKQADRFAINNPSIADELIAQGIDCNRLTTVKNGVDLEEFYVATEVERRDTRARLKLPQGPIALFAGQIIERKGVSSLLSAWPEVTASIKDATLIFAGTGAEVERVKRVAALSGSRVLYVGVRNDMAELMQASDVLVLPSHNESFGNVVIEAMACGLPVIVGPRGFAQLEQIEQTAGRVVDPRRPQEISCALRNILGEPSRAAELGRQARLMVEKYDYANVAREYLALYESVISHKKYDR